VPRHPGGGRTFYREVVRVGYPGPYLKKLATDVAEGMTDPEELTEHRPIASCPTQRAFLKDATSERPFKRYGD
jgi:hypothetical protein